jgi:hypothetical protein
MNKNIITSVGVFAAVLVLGYFALSYKTNDGVVSDAGQGNVANVNSALMTEDGKKMAFSEFIKNGGSYQCEVSQSVGGTETKGMTYINGDLIKGEYNTEVEGLSVDTNFIVRDGYTYTWSSMMPTMGFKSKISAAGSAGVQAGGIVKAESETSGTYSFNAEEIGDYNCEPWTADASVFALPAGVTFQEL